MLSSETAGSTPSTDGDGTPRKSPQPSPRPPQQDKQVNPLEKIEQLLTCSICLDRYKNPKLLPCQHTYCLPCLDNYVDTIHHNLKCPECRSEHSIPYEGAKGFPTNLTLTYFLDIHLEATDDNSEEIEAYINRYNMERCKICDEKSELEICHHCDRKTCKECRTSHMEMLKRDLGRLLNQIRRLSNRIKEASDSVGKGIQQLDSNVQSTQNEVKDYFQRYQSELKKREEHFLNDIEIFGQNEKRLMQAVRDVLEAEQKNLADSCSWVETALSGEVEVKDEELCRYKTVLVDGVENLRGFQPDTEDMFSKKLRFSPGDDASKLPTAISNFGELTVSLPQFAGRYLPLEQQYLPKPLRLGLESDSYKTSYRTTMEDNAARASKYKRPSDDYSQRARRFLQLDDDNSATSTRSSSNRLRPGPTDSGRASPLNSNGNTANPGTTQSTTNPSSSIYSRSPFLSNNQTTPTSTITTEIEEPASASTKNSATSSDLLSRRQQNQNSMVLPNVILNSNGSETSSTNKTTPSSTTAKTANNDTTVLTPTRRQKFKIICRSSSSNPMKRSDSADSLELTLPSSTNQTQRPSLSGNAQNDTGRSGSSAFAPPSNSSSSNYHPSSTVNEAAACVAQTIARLRSQDQTNSRSDSVGIVDSSPPPSTPTSRAAWMERRRQRFLRSRTNPDIFGSMDAADRAKLKASTNNQPTTTTALSARVQQLLSELDFKNAIAVNSTTSSPRSPVTNGSNGVNGSDLEQFASRSRFSRRSSIVPDQEVSHERASSRTGRSSSTLLNTPLVDYGSKSKPRLVFGRRGDGPAEMNWPRGIASLPGGEFAVCDSSNHRIQVFNKNGKLLREFGKYGTANGQLDSCAAIAYNRSKQQLVVSDRYNHRIQIFDLEGKFVKSFGGQGTENGKFKEPWGVALDELGLIYVVDKGNNRIQIFDQNGNFMSKFGSKGDGVGQFNSPLYIALHRRTQNIFISDSANNRISVHDHSGVPILTFGIEGFHTGQLKLPRGLAIDDQGFVIVADSGNNRVQVFSPEGKFVHGFGTWGSSPGQLKGIEAVALMEPEHQIIATDRENHRVQIF